jgi:hypothetical protein
MHYLDFLAGVHSALQPPTYVEVGVRRGDSLALSRARSVGIDPAYAVERELACDVHLVRATSDDYFARADALRELAGPVAMGLVDGLHVFESALRDFTNLERHAAWTSVVLLDDMFPRTVEEAARDRRTLDWTGDVYKNLLVLQRWRPELLLLPVHTSTTGMLVVLGLDPADTTLRDHYAEITAELASPDPQPVPSAVLDRDGAVTAEALLHSTVWEFLRDARDRGIERAEGMPALRELVAETRRRAAADFALAPIARPKPTVWPAPDPARPKKKKKKKAAAAKQAARRKQAASPPPSLARRALRKAARRLR